MAEPSKRLGRGLSSLISDPKTSKLADRLEQARQPGESQAATEDAPSFRTFNVPLAAIRPNPSQPRRVIGEAGIRRLAESLRRNGLIQPVVVRPLADPHESQDTVKYELISGERRWRAAREAGLSDVPVIIRDAGEEQLLELALVENIQREDLNPIDKALAYQEFTDKFGLSAEQLGQRVGEDRTTVANYLRLLELPEVIRDMVAEGLLSMGHARALISVRPESAQVELAKTTALESLSVRALEDLVRRSRSDKGNASSTPAAPREKRPHIRDLEQQFSKSLQTRVRIDEKRGQRGRIVIEYNSLDDFERICERLGIRL